MNRSEKLLEDYRKRIETIKKRYSLASENHYKVSFLALISSMMQEIILYDSCQEGSIKLFLDDSLVIALLELTDLMKQTLLDFNKSVDYKGSN